MPMCVPRDVRGRDAPPRPTLLWPRRSPEPAVELTSGDPAPAFPAAGGSLRHDVPHDARPCARRSGRARRGGHARGAGAQPRRVHAHVRPRHPRAPEVIALESGAPVRGAPARASRGVGHDRARPRVWVWVWVSCRSARSRAGEDVGRVLDRLLLHLARPPARLEAHARPHGYGTSHHERPRARRRRAPTAGGRSRLSQTTRSTPTMRASCRARAEQAECRGP